MHIHVPLDDDAWQGIGLLRVEGKMGGGGDLPVCGPGAARWQVRQGPPRIWPGI
jgi:hypothetical protein